MPCWGEARRREEFGLSALDPGVGGPDLSREVLGERSRSGMRFWSVSSTKTAGKGISWPSSVTRTSRLGSGRGAKRMRREAEGAEPVRSFKPSLVEGRGAAGRDTLW